MSLITIPLDSVFSRNRTALINLPAAKITGAGTSTSTLSSDDVNITSDNSIEEIDDVEMGDFLLEALSDTSGPIDEHDSFLDSLCAV